MAEGSEDDKDGDLSFPLVISPAALRDNATEAFFFRFPPARLLLDIEVAEEGSSSVRRRSRSNAEPSSLVSSSFQLSWTSASRVKPVGGTSAEFVQKAKRLDIERKSPFPVFERTSLKGKGKEARETLDCEKSDR